MSSFEEIGALLGFLAFAGLAVLVFLTFQQGRHLRRLRDWAGRAPERAAALAARDADPLREDDEEEISEEEIDAVAVTGPSRFDGVRDSMRERWAEIDRRLPVEPKLLLGGLAAIILGVGIATSGFGLAGGDDPTTANSNGTSGDKKKSSKKGGSNGEKSSVIEVAVLNGTAPPGGAGVAGIADRVSGDVEAAGFKVGTVGDASSFAASTVMWTGSPENEAEAQKLADSLATLLGTVTVVAMPPEIETLTDGADIALVVGQDDSTI